MSTADKADESDHRHDARFAESLGSVTGALVEEDLDLADVLDRLVVGSLHVLDVDAAAIVLRDHNGGLVPVASSNEEAHLLELFQLHLQQGPCLDAIRHNETVVSEDLSADRERWPAFAGAALAAGYRSIVAVPMGARGQSIGGLNLFSSEPAQLNQDRRNIGQSLADLAAVAIAHQRTARQSSRLTDQLQQALDSRIVIEQAKGVLAERYKIAPDVAFLRLRRYARDHNKRLGDIATSVVNGKTDPGEDHGHR